MDKATPSPRWWKRLPLRLSVRALMILILVIGGVTGWVVNRARKQREAVAAIERCTGSVWYYGHSRFSKEPAVPDWLRRPLGVDFFGRVEIVTFPFSPGDAGAPRPVVQDALDRLGKLSGVRVLELHGETATDAGLGEIRALTSLEDLKVDWCAEGVTDSGVAHLEGLKNLRRLALQGTRMTDAGLAHLATLGRLEFLMIDHNPITDAGLAHLRRLNGLKVLFLGGGRQQDVNGRLETVRSDEITDVGLEHLVGLRDLEELGIEGTGVTDRGLRQLEGLRKLRHLYVNGTRVTDDGTKRLQRATPGAKIHREPFSIEAPEIPPPS